MLYRVVQVGDQQVFEVDADKFPWSITRQILDALTFLDAKWSIEQAEKGHVLRFWFPVD